MFGVNTAEAAKVVAQQARDHLAELAQTGRFDELAYAVNAVAKAEGVHLAHVTAERAATNGLDLHEQIEVVTDLLLRGADDTWSGRLNDTNRAHADGVREAASRLLSKLRHQVDKENGHA